MKKLSAVARERLFVGQKLRRGGRRAVSARAQRRGGRERAKGTGVVAGARWERWGAPLELRSASTTTTTTTTTAHHHFPPLPSPLPCHYFSIPLRPTRPAVCARVFARAAGVVSSPDLLRLGTDPSDQPHDDRRDHRAPTTSLPYTPHPLCLLRRLHPLAGTHAAIHAVCLRCSTLRKHVSSRATYAAAVAHLVGLCITHTASLHSRDHQQGRGRVQRARSSELAHASYLLDTDSHSYQYYATAK